ncbi:BTAD domain-containing putative transcriptional regulator [Amycolatopsis sacchari]|uniref:AfsR/SARP family transcriptional regulator n=1 Tax=Amycolatopsis sacchari TaxID=115433 RepID=UPI003D761792
MSTELTLLSRVAFRGQEVTGPRLRDLLALLAADLRSGCGTARLVEGLWPDDKPENPTKALQILVSRARALLGADVIARTATGYRLTLPDEQVDVVALHRHLEAARKHAAAHEHAAALAEAEAGLALEHDACPQTHGDDPDRVGTSATSAGHGHRATSATTLSQAANSSSTVASPLASPRIPAASSNDVNPPATGANHSAANPLGSPRTSATARTGPSAASPLATPRPPAAAGTGPAASPPAASRTLAASPPGTGPAAASPPTTTPTPLTELRAASAVAFRELHRLRALSLARLNRHAEALPALLAAAGGHDEELLLELLRCEAATAGASAALARYEAYRRTLRDELGTDPGPALQALHRDLLQPPVRHGVQHEPNPLLGRDDDLAAVVSLLRTARVVSIVGPGGLGKTRLAHAVAREADQRVVHFVGLAGVTREEDIATEVASALGVVEARRPGANVVAGIAQALGSALLVLDNCEHLVGGVADLVHALVSLTRDARVLTTSRAPLGLSSESVYLLPELDLSTSIELFTQRARAARPSAELPADTVAELCRHLDGLPLAVELAAARVRVMSVADLAHRLADRFSTLRGTSRDAPARHRALHAVVEWSWQLLAPEAQQALCALSVFPSGFTAEAAQRLGAADALEELVDQSLLKVTDTPSGTRFRMLETVREFGAAKRTDTRVIEDFCAWAREYALEHYEGPFGADPAYAMSRLRTEQDNLVQALRYAIEREDGPTAAAIVAGLAAFWTFTSTYGRMAVLIEDAGRLLSHYRPEPEFVEVTRAAAAVCTAYAFAVQFPRATRTLYVLRRLPPAPPDTLIRALAVLVAAVPELDMSTLDEYCASPWPWLSGGASAVASYVRESDGDIEGARRDAERMLAVFEREGQPCMRILALSRFGELHLHLGNGEQARQYLGKAWRLQEELGVWTDEIGLRWALALASLQVGEVEAAARWAEDARTGADDDRFTYRSFDLGVQAELLLCHGEVDDGLRAWRHAVELLDDVRPPGANGEPALEPWTLEVKSVAVVAHARHGRLDLVRHLLPELRKAVSALLTATAQPTYLTGLPLCGALLLALGMAEPDRDGARLIALAEQCRYLRQFQPTMDPARIRDVVPQAAYSEAVSDYAGLSAEELRAAVLAAVS